MILHAISLVPLTFTVAGCSVNKDSDKKDTDGLQTGFHRSLIAVTCGIISGALSSSQLKLGFVPLLSWIRQPSVSSRYVILQFMILQKVKYRSLRTK
jgi:hypothetical protein